jgi:mannose-6-phosphate isomerase-like protein (cupin superfamily)
MKDVTGKISLDQTSGFDAEGFSGQEYILPTDEAGFNALLVTVKGKHPKKRMIDTVRNYFVVEGEGSFTLDGRAYPVKSGDLFVVGVGHEYEYEGAMKLFEFNVSPDNSFKDEILE